MYSSLLQLLNHIETEKLRRIIFKQLVQCLPRNFAPLRAQIEKFDYPATNKPTSLAALEKKLIFKKRSAKISSINSSLNSLENQYTAMSDQICQFKQYKSNFFL